MKIIFTNFTNFSLYALDHFGVYAYVNVYITLISYLWAIFHVVKRIVFFSAIKKSKKAQATDMNTSSKPVFIFIIAPPRSLSTVFLRSFLENTNVELYNDTLSSVLSPQNLLNGFVEQLIEDLENELDAKQNENKTIIFKGVSTTLIPRADYIYRHILKKWLIKYQMKFIYLVRQTKAQYASFHKVLEIEKSLNRLPKQAFEIMYEGEYYGPLLMKYKELPGKIIITEELQEDPSRVLKECFEYSGLIFKEDYLTYQSLTQIGIPIQWEYFKNWYADCLNSTYLRKGVTDISNIQIAEQDQQKIEKSEAIYNQLVRLSKEAC